LDSDASKEWVDQRCRINILLIRKGILYGANQEAGAQRGYIHHLATRPLLSRKLAIREKLWQVLR